MGRRAKQKVNPSFFPFISVLIAIIGVLTFLVLAVTLTALKPPLVVEADEDEVAAEGGGAAETRSVIVVEFKDGKAFVSNAKEGTPFYGLEFNADAEWAKVVEIHQQNRKHDPVAWSGTPFLDFAIEAAKQYKKKYILFLIRPTGVESYTILSDVIDIRNGIKLNEEQKKLVGHWVSDWTLVYVEEDRKVNLR